MKILSIALGLTLALGMTAGIAFHGLAAPEVAAPATNDFQTTGEPPAWGRLLPNMLKGEVISIDEGKTYFVIQSQEQELTISVNADTRYFIAPVPQKLAALAQNRLELRQQWQNSESRQERKNLQFRQECENQGECQNLQLRQQLRNTEELQIQSQERRKVEGPVSIKLWPMPVDVTNAEETQPKEPVAIELTPANAIPVVKPVPEEAATIKPATTSQTPIDKEEKPQNWSERLEWLHRFGKEATFDNITVGAKVLVVTAADEDNHLAKWVLIAEPITDQPLVGTVTSISLTDKTITIAQTDGGEAITLNYNEETRFTLLGTPKLEAGQSVRAIYDEEMVAKVVSTQ